MADQLYNEKQISDAVGAARRSVNKRLKTLTPAKLEPHPGHPIRWYRFSDLPADYQAAINRQALFSVPVETGIVATPNVAIATRHVAIAARPNHPARMPVKAVDADADQIIVRDARLGILNAISRAVREHGITNSRAIDAWLIGIKDGSMAPMQLTWCALANDKNGYKWSVDWRSGYPVAVAEPGQDLVEFAARLGRTTIFRWIRIRAESGDDALIPGKRGKDMRVPPWAPYFLANMQRPQNPSKQDAWDKMKKALDAKGWKEHIGNAACGALEYPGYSQACRWYNEKYSKLDAQKGRNTGSAMNPHKFCHKRTAEGMWPLLEVHSDGWNTHFTAPHPISGKFVTFEVWHSHCVATKKAYVSERSIGLSESMIVILGSLHAVCSQDGEPVVWQTDNTGSVKNDRVEFDPVTSIAARRGITIVHNLPGNSQANGIAENFNQYLDQRARDLATFQGRGMDSLTAKRVLRITQKMTRAMARCDMEEVDRLRAEAQRTGHGIVFQSYAEAVEWIKRIVDEFNDMPHRALPRISDPVSGKTRHMSPNEMMEKFVSEGFERKPLTGAELDDAFRVHERKTVRRGVVSIMGQAYHHAEMDHINGEDVMVAYDVNDGTRVWIKSLDGAPLFEAAIYQERSYRARSFYEIALEKRADAQIKRLDKKISDIEAQRPGVLIEGGMVEETAIPGMVIDALPEGAPAPSTAQEKPNLAAMGDYSRLAWLADHPEDWTPEYRRYLVMKVRQGSRVIEEALEDFGLWGEIKNFEVAAVSGN
jgi:putative transposase